MCCRLILNLFCHSSGGYFISCRMEEWQVNEPHTKNEQKLEQKRPIISIPRKKEILVNSNIIDQYLTTCNQRKKRPVFLSWQIESFRSRYDSNIPFLVKGLSCKDSAWHKELYFLEMIEWFENISSICGKELYITE